MPIIPEDKIAEAEDSEVCIICKCRAVGHASEGFRTLVRKRSMTAPPGPAHPHCHELWDFDGKVDFEAARNAALYKAQIRRMKEHLWDTISFAFPDQSIWYLYKAVKRMLGEEE